MPWKNNLEGSLPFFSCLVVEPYPAVLKCDPPEGVSLAMGLVIKLLQSHH